MDPSEDRQISSTINDFTNGPCNSTLTSRISIQKFCCVVAQFDQMKRDLAKETGFGALLEIKISHKTNLKFSSFLMERLDPDTSKVIFSLDRQIEITDADVQDVFGLPQGSRQIPTGLAGMSEACIKFTKLASIYSPKGIHSLKAAESILAQPLGENSTRVQRDCFKIAFVVFSIGHVLNPSAKHDYTSVEYWAALVVPSEIDTFNWCQYVRVNLLKGARKLRADISQQCNTIQIIGCHLLLQVAVLDKLTLSSQCIPQNITPRTKVFDHVTIKRAIQAVTWNVFSGTTLCVSNCSVIGEHQEIPKQPPTHLVCSPFQRHGKNVADGPEDVEHIPHPHPAPKVLHMADVADFVNEMHGKYPNMASEHLGILLKERNSSIIDNINEFRHCTVVAMLSFFDNLVRSIGETCPCCKILGRQSCVLASNVVKGTDTPSPVASKDPTNIGLRSSTEGSSTWFSGHTTKRVYAKTKGVPESEIRRLSNKKAQIMLLCQLEHQATPHPILPRLLFAYLIIGKIIELWLTDAKQSILSSVWFKHPSPRVVTVVGSSVRREIIGLHNLSHACCAIIVHRLCQIDLSYAELNNSTIWRKVMEPDLTTLVLRGRDPRYVKSIHRKLLSVCWIDKCRMFIFPSLLQEGSCCYMLDMLRKRVIVLDPLVGIFGFSHERVKLHEFVSNKILESFFMCVDKFFTSWNCSKYGWTRSFATLTSQNIESHDHGFCALFMALNHNGEELLKETDQVSLKAFRQGILYELIRFRDNESNIPAEVMESIKSALNI